MIGDINLPDINWHNERGIVNKQSRRYAFHQNALDIIQQGNMRQLIHEPTHIAGNTLDLVLVAKSLFDDLKVKCEVLPRISDHNMIQVSIHHPETKGVTAQRKVTRYNFTKADYNKKEANFT